MPSFGTFGFWSAYLKGSGDVILATGTSKVPTFVEYFVRRVLPKWIFLQDPCFKKDHNGKVHLDNKCLYLA